MNDIFISYSSLDRVWAEELETALERSGVNVYRDKQRLVAATPYQDQLFKALKDSHALIIIWSNRVRDMKGEWKEWVITEREHFRTAHPDAPIIYLLLDEEQPKVDAHTHKLDQIRGAGEPGNVDELHWKSVLDGIKKAAFSDRIEIDCYVAACLQTEFETLRNDQNLKTVLQRLELEFDDIVQWYGDTREQWRPAGGRQVSELLNDLENIEKKVFAESGVPEHFLNKQIFLRTGLNGLWAPNDDDVGKEIARLHKQTFGWFLVDPLSIYHPLVYRVAQHAASCIRDNPLLNVFIIDPTGYLRDKSVIRDKLRLDCREIYELLLKPRIDGNSTFLGTIDAWHVDDFERVFRETVRYYRNTVALQSKQRSPQSAYTNLGGGR
jgi:hypothetical protein